MWRNSTLQLEGAEIEQQNADCHPMAILEEFKR